MYKLQIISTFSPDGHRFLGSQSAGAHGLMANWSREAHSPWATPAGG